MERIIDVAQYIFDKYKEISGDVIDEMKLHKLLYFTQREYLAIVGEQLFAEEFEGWKFGPVNTLVRSCYTAKGMYADGIKPISEEAAYIVNNVILQYGGYASWKLSEISHNELSWQNARIGIQEGQNGNRKLELADIIEDAKKVRPYDSLFDMYYDEFEDAEDDE